MFKHIFQQHRVKVITSADNEDVQHIRVRRSHIFSDALRQYSRESFDCSKCLRIRFIGEVATAEATTIANSLGLGGPAAILTSVSL